MTVSVIRAASKKESTVRASMYGPGPESDQEPMDLIDAVGRDEMGQQLRAVPAIPPIKKQRPRLHCRERSSPSTAKTVPPTIAPTRPNTPVFPNATPTPAPARPDQTASNRPHHAETVRITGEWQGRPPADL